MAKKWTKRKLVVWTAHLLVLSLFLFPTMMELASLDFHTWTYDEITNAPPRLRDGNFLNGEIINGRARYMLFIGPFVIRSFIA